MKFLSKKIFAVIFSLSFGFWAAIPSSSFADRATSYTYDAQGRVISLDGPRTDVNDVSTFTYDSSGNLKTFTNALGQTTRYNSYDSAGHILSLTDQTGVTQEFTYDDNGLLLTSTIKHPNDSRLNSGTSYYYDGAGLLIGMKLANGAQLTYEYDAARRLTAVKNSAGDRLEYTLDAAGNRLKETKKNSTGVISYSIVTAFDELSRVIKVASNHNQVTQYKYDPNDNQSSEIDGRLNETQRTYDALNRVAKIIDSSLKETSYTYDSQNRIKTVTDSRGNTTSYKYDGFGNLITQSSPDTGTTNFTYDDAGNRTSAVDARGFQSTYQYDALNRLTAIVYPASPSENVVYSYDNTANGSYGTGHLASIENGGSKVEYTYNHLGLVTRKISTIGSRKLSVQYTYDLAGNITNIIYPSGRSIVYSLDSLGRPQSVFSLPLQMPPQVIAANFKYLPFGPVSSFSYGNGLSHTYSYDSDYRLTAVKVGGIMSRNYEYDSVDNVIALYDLVNSNKNQTFSYDNLNRLVSAKGIYGKLQYTYDDVGNRLSESKDNFLSTYSYETNSNRLASIVNGAISRNFYYDPAGNRVEGSDESKQIQKFSYNAANRLNSISFAGNKAIYAYNGLGQRISKTVGNNTEFYTYDEAGSLISVADGSGNTLREYIYAGATLLSFLNNGSTYYVHNDHRNAPQVVTNQSQSVVFMADYQPFGKVALGQTNSIELYSRFPGQSFDSESGLYYNYFRDYDPSIGRYIESDPIGLQGGINTYAYVEGNPIKHTDPTGQFIGALVNPVTLIFGAWATWMIVQTAQNQTANNNNPTTSKSPDNDVTSVPTPKPLDDPFEEASEKSVECPSDNKPCPPCRTVSGRIIPVGTVGYRPLDIIPDDKMEHGVYGSHHNIFIANQAPNGTKKACKCFWAKQNYVLKPNQLNASMVPVEPFL